MIDTATAPAPSTADQGTWVLDPTHSSLHFAGRQMMISTVRGHFATFDATVRGDESDPENASVEVTVDAASLDSGLPARDEHLRSPDLLDTTTFPTIHFRSTSIRRLDEERLSVTGDLTIKGVTRSVEAEATLRGVAVGMSGARRAAFTTEFTIDRGDWGMTFNVPLGGDAVLIGRDITLLLELTVEEAPTDAPADEASPSA